jgi:radical SAM superfamily enzyme YgiQ (UPF0313 family)
MLLNLPNPPGRNIYRGYAGGFGTTGSTSSKTLIPIYLIYAASALEKINCEYTILDGQAMKLNKKKVKNAVMTDKPDILMAWISLPSFYEDITCLNEIKKACENTIIIAWGTVCNLMAEEIFSKSNIDLILKGEYPYFSAISNLFTEENLTNLSVKNYSNILGVTYEKGGRIISNPPVNEELDVLDRLSLNVYFKIPVQEYVDYFETSDNSKIGCIPIITSAGCPFHCIYCPYPIGYGKRVKYKSINNIIREIEFLKINFGINGFLFRDQLFTHNKKRVEELCNKLIQKNLNIKWLIEARADQLSKELLETMKKAGCFKIYIGVETGSQQLIDIGKPGSNLEVYKKAFKQCKDLDISTVAHIILGLPGETQETVQDTINLLYYIDPDAININVLTPYPGTKLYELAVKSKWIVTFDWSKYTSHTPVMETDTMRIEELNIMKKKIKRKFRNHKLLRDSAYRKRYLSSLPRKAFVRGKHFLELLNSE